jgi:hypothetical protein
MLRGRSFLVVDERVCSGQVGCGLVCYADDAGWSRVLRGTTTPLVEEVLGTTVCLGDCKQTRMC